MELRSIVEAKLDRDTSRVPSHVLQKVDERIARAVKKNAALDADRYKTLTGKLEYFDLRELQDTITSKGPWAQFESRFGTKEALMYQVRPAGGATKWYSPQPCTLVRLFARRAKRRLSGSGRFLANDAPASRHSARGDFVRAETLFRAPRPRALRRSAGMDQVSLRLSTSVIMSVSACDRVLRQVKKSDGMVGSPSWTGSTIGLSVAGASVPAVGDGGRCTPDGGGWR